MSVADEEDVQRVLDWLDRNIVHRRQILPRVRLVLFGIIIGSGLVCAIGYIWKWV